VDESSTYEELAKKLNVTHPDTVRLELLAAWLADNEDEERQVHHEDGRWCLVWEDKHGGWNRVGGIYDSIQEAIDELGELSGKLGSR
jgi:hypothetical protein